MDYPANIRQHTDRRSPAIVHRNHGFAECAWRGGHSRAGVSGFDVAGHWLDRRGDRNACAFRNGLASPLTNERDREPARITFLVAASGVILFGIGSAFWELIAGSLTTHIKTMSYCSCV